MRLILLLLFILPKLLFASRVLVISDFSAPLPQTYNSLKELPFFYRLKFALEPQGIICEESDLTSFALTKKKRFALFQPKTKKTKDISHFVFWNYPSFAKRLDLSLLPKEKMILFIFEPPTVQPRLYKKTFHDHFSKVYTWDDARVDGKKYCKFFYPVLKQMRAELPPFEKRKFCTQIITKKQSNHPQELYSEREKIIRFFEERCVQDFEFYGFGWTEKEYPSYRGSPKDKINTLKNYRFSICYENMQGIKGYITEKIFDCFETGTIPIYLGASNIEEYIPKGCFIDRRLFSSDTALLTFLQKLTKKEYEEYLENIRTFLKSEKASYFTFDYFKKTFSETLHGH